MTTPLRDRALRVLWATSHGAGRMTSGLRPGPDFLIVGAQRCGTTSMLKTLSQHPAILPPVFRKGVHYFDVNYDRGPAWYTAHFPTALRRRLVERRAGATALVGESSPYYLFHPLAGERIAADLPEIRLVVLLRDPVERAYSAHAHERARGFETEDFARAVELEPRRTAGERERLAADPTYASDHWRHHAYLARGEYIDQLEALAALVGRDRMCVVDSGDLFTDPRPGFAEVLGFLGLPEAPGITFQRHNARPRSPLDPCLRGRLDDHFRPYDERLAAWWGRTPSWRR